MATPPRRVRSQATPFYLDTLFGNLWSNAIQAVEPSACAIELQCVVDLRRLWLAMLVIDNGPGFAASHVETAFTQTFSTKGLSRGRGLLEVADAVHRLQGEIRLVPVQGSEHRIQIQVPVEA
jgi:sensor histidine kinase regulating citrate/malate metabolism